MSSVLVSLDVIHKGINQAAAVSLGALRGGDSELLQQEQDLITGEGEGLFASREES